MMRQGKPCFHITDKKIQAAVSLYTRHGIWRQTALGLNINNLVFS